MARARLHLATDPIGTVSAFSAFASSMVTVEVLDPNLIMIDTDRAVPDEGTVAMLMDSIAKVGLLNPITVWRKTRTNPYLIAGRNRLEAVRRLGHSSIRCIVLPEHNPTSKADAAIAEIVENLHRREISAKERRALIVAYAEIVREREATSQDKPGQPDRVSVGGRGKVGIASKVASDLGVSERTARRALAPTRQLEPSPAAEPLRPAVPADLAALRRAWAAASAESRATFLAELRSGEQVG